MKEDKQNASSSPKKRGRKPGSKNKNKSKRRSSKSGYVSVFAELEKEIQALAAALQKAQAQATKEIEKLEQKQKKAIEAARDKALSSVKIWKNRAKEYRQKMLKAGSGVKRSVGRPAATNKPAAKRGRPTGSKNTNKGGGRRKAGVPTKKDLIMNYMVEHKEAITSKDLISKLLLISGEKDTKKFSQGIYTTLTQIYKTGALKNKGGKIVLGKK